MRQDRAAEDSRSPRRAAICRPLQGLPGSSFRVLEQVAVGLNRRFVDAVVDRVAALTERGYNRMRLLKSNPL